MSKNGNGVNAQDVIDAIVEGKGYASKAAEILKVSRTTFYKYLDKYATAKQALEDEREKRHDKVELKLMDRIEKNDTTAIIFYLKTQCKSRGYIERQEIAGVKDQPITIVNWDENQEDTD